MPRPSAAEKAKAITVGELATRAHYEVLRAGRETIQQSAPRWRRVTDGKPCGFCAMVASRGPVYRSEQKAGQGRRYHSRCGCTVEPYFGDPADWVPSPEEARFLEAYQSVYRTGMSPDELSDAIEKWLEEAARDTGWKPPALAPRSGPIVGAMATPPPVGSWVPHSDQLFARTQSGINITPEAIAKQDELFGKLGDAREAYCLDAYGQMNAYMRTGEVSQDLGRYTTKKIEQYADDMVKAFDRSEPTTTYSVFKRGVRASDDFDPATYYTEGAVLQEAGFTSTTISGEAEVFARGDGWVMNIMVPPGHPTVLGTYYEREVILPPGITQRVVKVDKEARRIWIEVDPPA